MPEKYRQANLLRHINRIDLRVIDLWDRTLNRNDSDFSDLGFKI
jgi:hypothetical protein